MRSSRWKGFGSVERDNFVWCGKRIRRAADGTVRLPMVEYHENLKEVMIRTHRKRQPEAPLTEPEGRQLGAVLGSLQWLVAQIRFDMSLTVSALQGEKPIISTLIRANVRTVGSSSHFVLSTIPRVV